MGGKKLWSHGNPSELDNFVTELCL